MVNKLECINKDDVLPRHLKQLLADRIAARSLEMEEREFEREIGYSRHRRRRDLDDSSDDDTTAPMWLLREKVRSSEESFNRFLESRHESRWKHARRLDKHLKRGSVTAMLTNDDAELEVHQRDSNRCPRRGLFKTDQQETGEHAARNAQASVPPKPSRSSVSQVDGTQTRFVASPAKCKLLPKDDLDVRGRLAEGEGDFDAMLLRIEQLRRKDLQRDFVSMPAGMLEVEEQADHLERDREVDMVERELHSMESGGSEDGGFESQQMRDSGMRDVELVKNNMRHTVLKLQEGLRDMQQQRRRLEVGFRNLFEDFDCVIHNYNQHIDRWRETIQIIEVPYRNRAVGEGRRVEPAASSCSSKNRRSRDVAAERYEWVVDFMDCAVLGVSIFMLYRMFK
ncbi:hypothetical protein CDAR_288181 [Caerostris darwini]|uniref:Uncharacterized protein n=1 Tax=Caerostris darwini TaxID=1538125 RepID=A0AAV4WD47_9ARAC|nr:hypothetical protein CDAR_288181 [Caerostris darwini]